MEESKERKTWIDALRAVAMIFVIFGHNAQWCDTFFLFTTPIKIPLFFAISGYLFNDRKGIQIDFFKSLFFKLLLPFFCLVTIPALLLSLYQGVEKLLESWYKMISGDSYWFITCLIVAEVIHFYIRRACKTTLLIVIVCIIVSAIGLFAAKNDVLHFGKVNTALICQAYLLLGLLLKQYEKKLDRLSIEVTVGIFVMYVVLCFVSQFIFSNIMFDCNQNLYYNISFCTLLIVMGCMSCFMLAKRITKIPRWVIFIGQNTFILYLWCGFSMLLFAVLGKLGLELPQENLLYSLVQTIWATVACMFAAFVVNRYAPFIVGRKKRKQY